MYIHKKLNAYGYFHKVDKPDTPKMRTIYYASVQKKKDLQSPNIHNLIKHNKGSPYIVLITGDIAFKDCMSSLRYVHKTTWHFYRAFGVNHFHVSFPLLSPFSPHPSPDILIVNALEQRVKHSQRQSEVNKNTFFLFLLPFPPTPSPGSNTENS